MTMVTNNGVLIPSIIYGTAWKEDETARLVQVAIESGYRAIDTANQNIHYRESLVGSAIRAVHEKGIQRESLFLQTKFTSVSAQGPNIPYDANAVLATQVKQSMDSSLRHLRTDYVDSYLLHGPSGAQGLVAADWETWSAIEQLYMDGKARTIGVSNVSCDQLKEICANARIKPMIVQNRCYALMGWDESVRNVCRDNNIVYQAFSLLTANREVLIDPRVKAISDRVGASAEQIIFAFAVRMGILPLTGTSNTQHMKDNLGATQLAVTDEDIRIIESSGFTEVFRDVFDRPDLIASEDMNATNVEGWDSFMQVNLIIALEERFNVQFTTQEIGELTCVGDVMKLLKYKKNLK